MGVEKLVKSLDEIEAMADDVLAKSLEAEEAKEDEDEEEVEKGMQPDEIADDAEEAKEDEDEKGDAEEDEDEDEGDEDEEEAKKSLADELSKDETIGKSIEVSSFLEQFTRLNGEAIDEIRDDVSKSLETSVHTATVLAKSFNAIMKSQNGLMDIVKSQNAQLAEQGELIKSLQERLEGVERQPVQRKAVVNTVEKSFNHSAGLESAGEPSPLSKSQKLDKLTNLAMEGKHGVTISDVVSYESTGVLRPELESILNEN